MNYEDQERRGDFSLLLIKKDTIKNASIRRGWVLAASLNRLFVVLRPSSFAPEEVLTSLGDTVDQIRILFLRRFIGIQGRLTVFSAAGALNLVETFKSRKMRFNLGFTCCCGH